MDGLVIYEMKPISLTLDRVGPFRENPYCVDFTDESGEPCNVFMLISKNGSGKTTVLDVLASLYGMLELDPHEAIRFGQEDLDEGNGRAQLDLRVRLSWNGEDLTIVLSLLAGELGPEVSLKVWADDDLKSINADSWHRFGYRRISSGRLSAISKSDELALDIASVVRNNFGSRPDGQFEGNTLTLPTALFFSAYRDIPPIKSSPGSAGSKRGIAEPNHWGYSSLQRFNPHSDDWEDSLDNLLVWLKWLDDGRFEKAREIINERAFSDSSKVLLDVRRDPPEAVVRCNSDDEQEHRLDRLSSGEKSLAYLFLRIGAHTTQNSIILIDELDIHVHIRWQHKLVNELKALVARNPGLVVIMTTHSTEILDVYSNSLKVSEDGLIKGGHIITNMK